MKELLLLFYEFFKTGLFAVGGGPATIPFLMGIADKYPWFSRAQLSDMIAISESTPGPVGVNMATYAGFNTAGIKGGIISTLALVIPSIIIILIIARFLEDFQENKIVKAVFAGVKPAVTALIAVAVLSIIQVSLFETEGGNGMTMVPRIPSIIIAIVIFIALQLSRKIKLHPVVWFAGSAIVGIILKL